MFLSVVLLSNLLSVSVTCVPWHQMEVEQLLSLSGSALAQAVSSLLETPGLYVFSDILELPNVREVNMRSHTLSSSPFVSFRTFSDPA